MYVYRTYALNAKDSVTGRRGSFLLDQDATAKAGKPVAAGNIYPTMSEFYERTTAEERAGEPPFQLVG